MYDELGIGELLDQAIPQDSAQRQVSVGQGLKALVLNGLGFVNRALYLLPPFFEDKPTERLIGTGIEPAHLNDDVLGRALDSLYEHDVTSLFTLISAHVCHRLGLTGSRVHLDSTRFHVDGRYQGETEGSDVEIRRGYSRDRRPDLNQVMLNLIVEHQAGLPLLMQPRSGNSNDTVSFGKLIETHIDQVNMTHQVAYWVPERLALAQPHRDEVGELSD
jgi:transposase